MLATIIHREDLPEHIRNYYPDSKPWIVDIGVDANWHVFPTYQEAEDYQVAVAPLPLDLTASQKHELTSRNWREAVKRHTESER